MRRVVSGGFELALPAADGIELLTPEGERSWVPGWDPVYPSGEASEDPGTVFTTDVGGHHTVWLIQNIDRRECTANYARVTVGHHAGTVSVRCLDRTDGGCSVSVTYDLTLLHGSDPTSLDAYNDKSFNAMMDDWATEIGKVRPR